MKYIESGTPTSTVTYLNSPTSELCTCLPLSRLHREVWENHSENSAQQIEVTPATLELNSSLRAQLENYFPGSTPLSILLLHIAQLEHIHITPKSAISHKRHRYHVPASLLDQILINVRRTIRSSDNILVHEGASIAIMLPDVDQEGAQALLERVYHSINLLQPETVIPPLKRETEITLGIGSYPKPGASLEELLYQTGFIASRITLRPAVTTQLHGSRSISLVDVNLYDRNQDEENDSFVAARNSGIPFMQLPALLSSRLKHLIPYSLACELRCAPVGRDHNRLTVAMASPGDTRAIERLYSTTGMTIFPVACETQALDSLLEQSW
ncbi:MAG: GspE/PulE/PilB domain-containing protein [Ktedonobacteraceae bacterium]